MPDMPFNLGEIKRESDKMEATINRVLALNGGGRYFQTVGTGMPLVKEGHCFSVLQERNDMDLNFDCFLEKKRQ